MRTMYAWAFCFFVFSFIMGWCATGTTGAVQVFYICFSLVGLGFSVILGLLAYLQGLYNN